MAPTGSTRSGSCKKTAIPDSQIKTRTSPALSTYDLIHATFISKLANFILMAILGSTFVPGRSVVISD
jgi:hypothetical protein